MAMPQRTYNSPDYRYGFNGKEKDESGEWGDLTHYDYGFRIYNPGIGKFLSVDPLTQSYPWYTPYQFAGNKPITAIDLDGKEEDYVFNSPVKTHAVLSILNDESLTIKQKETAIFILGEYWNGNKWPDQGDYDWLNSTAKTIIQENTETCSMDLSDANLPNKVVEKMSNGTERTVNFYGHVWSDMEGGVVEKRLLYSVALPANVEIDGPRERDATAFENFIYWRVKDLQDVDDLVAFAGLLGRHLANTGGADGLQKAFEEDVTYGDQPDDGVYGWLFKKLDELNPQDSGTEWKGFIYENYKDFKEYKDTQYIIDFYNGDTLRKIIESVKEVPSMDRKESEVIENKKTQ